MRLLPNRFPRRGPWLLLGAGLPILAAGGCSDSVPTSPVPNTPPRLTLTASPLPGDSVSYQVLFRWFATDEDGEVTRVVYAVDPPPDGDTAWVETRQHEVTIPFPSTSPNGPASSSPHVFVARAWDNDGAASPSAFRSFTSFTVAPESRIQIPKPNPTGVTLTLTNLTISWSGSDPDGATTQEPIGYRYKLASQEDIRQALGISSAPSTLDLQIYFERDAPSFDSWERASPDSTSRTYENLTPGPQQYFAVVAFDEAGAYESRFVRGANLLHFQPTVTLPLPRLSIWTPYFSYEQSVGTPDLSEHLVQKLQFVPGKSIRFQWDAVPWIGTQLTGYRWILDPLNGDLSDETPRRNETETWRWSDWALSEREATIGPFEGAPGQDPPRHRFYVQVRDNANRISAVAVEILVLTVSGDRPLLVVDDFRALPDVVVMGDPNHPQSYQPYGSFPSEAILDTLFFAVGDKPYQKRPPGTLSLPGVFAGFDYDTLDYRFSGVDGLPLEVLLRYRAVVVFTGLEDATRSGTKTSGLPYMAALRHVCQPGVLNTLTLYVEQGGQLWLFGHGAVLAMIRGTLGGRSNTPHLPSPGSFLYESLKARSLLLTPFRSRGGDLMVGATPNLPQFATPGRTWPPSTWTGSRGPNDDPRVGPAAVRNLERWDGLPQLNLTAEYPNYPIRLPSSLGDVVYVGGANQIVEDLDPGPGVDLRSTLDTLYLYRGATYRNEPYSDGTPTSDGKPAMLAYQGGPGGLVVWSTIPFWYMDRRQMQQVADVVLGNMGITRRPNPAEWTGPGTAHGAEPPVGP